MATPKYKALATLFQRCAPLFTQREYAALRCPIKQCFRRRTYIRHAAQLWRIFRCDFAPQFNRIAPRHRDPSRTSACDMQCFNRKLVVTSFERLPYSPADNLRLAPWYYLLLFLISGLGDGYLGIVLAVVVLATGCFSYF